MTRTTLPKPELTLVIFRTGEAEPRIERFRRAVRNASRRDLLNKVDHYLEQMDQAEASGDRSALAWAKARWNAVWDELDARDGIPTEAAS